MTFRPASRGLLVALVVALAACSSTSTKNTRTTKPPSPNDSTTTTGAPFSRPACEVQRPAAPTSNNLGGSEFDITSFDGTVLRAHWFPKPGTSAGGATGSLPTVMKGPGWGTPGDTNATARGDGLFGDMNILNLHDAGYNVLTWDPRGFGASKGTITINSPDFEGRDVQVLLDFLAAQPGVQLDKAGDPRVGMVGGSYGGGIQLVTAALDCRVDAIVPTIAWHSLETSLYKNQTYKSGWANFLYDFSKDRNLDPHIVSAHDEGNATGQISAEDERWFKARGPLDLIKQINIPTLIIQGTVDTLFTLDEGVSNYEMLKARGVPVAMVWYCGGHGVCFTKAGDQAFNANIATAWLDRYVKGDAAADIGAAFSALDQRGELVTANVFPAKPGESVTAVGEGTLSLDRTTYAANVPVKGAPSAVLGGIAGTITPSRATNGLDTVISFTQPAVVLGAPKLSLTYTGTAGTGTLPTRMFAQLVDSDTNLVLGNQATPIALELDGKQHSVSLPLEMVVFSAAAGSKLSLQLVASSPSYVVPQLGGRVDISQLKIELPTVTGLAAQ